MKNLAPHTSHLAPVRTMKNLLRICAVIPLATSLSYSVEAGNDDKTPKGPEKKEEDFLKSLKTPEGMTPAVWAKDQQILNAIAIDVDEKGRVFTSETFRWRKGGVIDVRNFMFLYKDDLQVKTSADRAAMIEKWKDKFPKDFFTHAASLRQGFPHCAIFPTAASRRSLDRVSVPVWPITLSGRLPIFVLVSLYLTN